MSRATVVYTPMHRKKQELKDHYFQRVKGVRNAPFSSCGLPCGNFASISLPPTGTKFAARPNFSGGPKPVPGVSALQLEPARYHESRCCKHGQSWPGS